MLKRALYGVAASAVLLAECVQVPEVHYGRLEVVATDLTGARIPDVKIELEPAADPRHIRYGDYRLRTFSPGFRIRSSDIRIARPHTVVRIELEVSMECGDKPRSIIGSIRLDSAADELWVKAVPVRGSGGTEAQVTSAGHFLLAGLEASTYILNGRSG